MLIIVIISFDVTDHLSDFFVNVHDVLFYYQ